MKISLLPLFTVKFALKSIKFKNLSYKTSTDIPNALPPLWIQIQSAKFYLDQVSAAYNWGEAHLHSIACFCNQLCSIKWSTKYFLYQIENEIISIFSYMFSKLICCIERSRHGTQVKIIWTDRVLVQEYKRTVWLLFIQRQTMGFFFFLENKQELI